MHSDPHHSNVPAEDALTQVWIEALRAHPSEQGGPSHQTDAAILASSRKMLAGIRRRRFHQRFWPVLAAAACVALAFSLFLRSQSNPSIETNTTTTEDPYALILREVSLVFPRQIKAIFADGSDLQIELADNPRTGNEQAVVIEICERQSCKIVITYIGQTLQIGDHQISVRMNDNGGLVIDSPDFKDARVRPAIKSRRI